MGAIPDGANGAYMLEGLLEKGRRMLVNAGDAVHFVHHLDRFLLESLKTGRYYSTQGPRQAGEPGATPSGPRE